jgi:hypothetical protein
VAAAFLAARHRLALRAFARRPSADTLACLSLALLYRLPALLHPWGFVNRDGAYGAFIAMHLLAGVRPSPVFTEGAPYQGSLKGHLSALLALLTGSRDFSLLMVGSSLLLYAIFLVASMALARRLGGRAAAVVTGLYLAASPKFLTTFSLNCVGQYMDVLALGGLALAHLARLIDDERSGAGARGSYFAIGLLLGAAFWQQPVALSYLCVAALALASRRRSWTDPWTLLTIVGLAVGALPVLLFNLQNDWVSSGILGRDPEELKAQAEALPVLVRRTLGVALPVLAGLSPGHPWAASFGVRLAATALIPMTFAAYSLLKRRELIRGVRARGSSAALLPVLLAMVCLAFYWATAAGHIDKRPRYLLPVLAAGSVMLGVAGARVLSRSRPIAVAGGIALMALLAFNAAGTAPRLRESAEIERYWQHVVQSLEEKGIRTGYSDFAIAAPVTMFTAERITLSARLGPTPAYQSDLQERRVALSGENAFVLAPGDDASAFAALLESLGVSYRRSTDPVEVFWALSRPVRLEQLSPWLAHRAPGPESPPAE